MNRRLRHIVVWLFLLVVWLGAAANTTVRLKNYDIWKDMPSKTLMEMGEQFFSTGQADSALVCYNIVANRYYNNDNKDTVITYCSAQAMNELGILYTFFFFDYEKAHKYLRLAEKIANENNYYSLLSTVYNNMCNIYLIDSSISNDGKLDDRAIKLYHKSFEKALEAKNPESILVSAFNIAHIASDSANYIALQDDIIRFLRYKIPDSLLNSTVTNSMCIAVIEQNRGNYDEALMWYDIALANVHHQNKRASEIIKSAILNNKCYLFVLQRQNQKALDIMNELVRYGKASNNHYVLFVSYMTLSQFFHDVKKDTVQGDRYELMALREKDIVLNKNKLLEAEKIEFLFQIDEINAEVQELNYRQRLMKIIAWCIAAIVLLILGFFYLLWRKYKQEQEKNRVLYEKNQEWLAADEERRQRIIIEQQAPRAHQLEEGERSDLLHRVFFIMETNDEVFSPGFTLPRLAELVDDTRNNVSEAINQLYNTNFNGLINEYRIKEACRRINDEDHYGNLRIEAIGQSLGFKSNSNFVSNFKKITGLTPSAYRKQGKTMPVSELPGPPKGGLIVS